MKYKKTYSGLAIALAWPETYCKQPGAWYDPITLMMGINKNNYYKVGHAALVLIDKMERKANYFDFGRYHTPYKQGRVRSAETDHDLEIETRPVLSEDGRKVLNVREILTELQQNPACHGEGKLHAGLTPINFERAFAKAKQMQEKSPLPYGPFILNGSNCSRFVRTVIQAGRPTFSHRLRLMFLLPVTPTPMSNVLALNDHPVLPKLLKIEPFYPKIKRDKAWLGTTLPAPARHKKIPANAQWLSGEGAGSWFVAEPVQNQLKVTRYSPQGNVECSGIYKHPKISLDKNHPFSIKHPTDCKTLSLQVAGSVFRFRRIGN